MIQVYRAENTDYNHNGDMTLFPSSAILTAAINDVWSVQLEHPIDAFGRWKYLTDGAVVKLPSFNGEQLFRIKETEKMDSGVTAVLEPIFMDAMDDCFLFDVNPTGKNGQEALDMMTAPNPKYKGKSNILTVTDGSYQYQNLIEAINGDDEGSFVNRWGGEILFDNYTINVNYQIGQDNGVELRYGKNIPEDGLTESVDTRDVVTRIYPLAYNGYPMSGNGCVDSPLISRYPTVKTRTMTFDDVKMRADAQESDAEKGVTICDTQEELDAALKARCDAQYSAGVDKPKVTIAADMVLLENTSQYREYAALEKVSLGDTVRCIHSRLGITTRERVIELTYDCIGQKVAGVVLGQKSANYFDKVSGTISRVDSAIRQDGTVIADQVTGRLNASLAQLVGQYNVAEKQDVLAILFENLDETSEMFGALAIGTQGILISKQRTADGKDWVWTTAINYAGVIADTIVSGLISSKDGRVYIDLDKGESTTTKLIGKSLIGDRNIEVVIGQDREESSLLEGITLNIDGESKILLTYPVEGTESFIAPKLTVLPPGARRAGAIEFKNDLISILPPRSAEDSVRRTEFGGSINVAGEIAVLAGIKNEPVPNMGLFPVQIKGGLTVEGDLDVENGSKNRVVNTSQGKVRIAAYETAEPYFGDIGEAKIGENGQARIDIDPLFAETVNTSCPYQVFLQPYSDGVFYVAERAEDHFIVKGPKNGSFGYEIKARQKGYEKTRLSKF